MNQPEGIIEYNGSRALNIYRDRPVAAAEGPVIWGPDGQMPLLSAFYEAFFDPAVQRDHFFAWAKYAYEAALKRVPLPGQCLVFMGRPGCGKTFNARFIIGEQLLGGYADASEYLIKGGGFNSHLLEKFVWCSDDDMMAESSQSQTNYTGMVKKMTANQDHMYSKKYEVPVQVRWGGRIIVTLNLDYASTRTLGSLDNSILDKMSIFRCSETPFNFPDRVTLAEQVKREVPYFARFLLDFEVPAHVQRDVRYGYKAYHEPTLLDLVHQSSKCAPFKEVLVQSLRNWFADNKNETVFRGTLSQVTRLLLADPFNADVIRSLRLEQTNRYMEAIQREGLLKMTVETGKLRTRVWIIHRLDESTN